MKYLLLFSLLLLASCGHTPEKVIVTDYVLIPIECEDFGQIEPVRALPVVFVQARTEDGFNVLGLRGDMYSNLSIVMKDTLRYIGAQNEAISYYKKCISDHNEIDLNEEGEPL